MITLDVNWTDFKAFVDGYAIAVQWVIALGQYNLIANHDRITLKCTIAIALVSAGDQLDFETNYMAKGNIVQPMIPSPFGSKYLGNKKLYKRVIGVNQLLIIGTTNIIYASTLAIAKMNAIEIINGQAGDTLNFYVLDTVAGTYTGTPNSVIDQYGFASNVSKDYYAQKSEFDADIPLGVQLKIAYTSIGIKTVGVNFVMNELKLA